MINWLCCPFDKLSLQQLYDIMVLRQEVFVVEQDCPYLDADGKDQASWHLMAYQGDDLVAYTRIVPQGVSYEHYVSIGRVVNSEKVRGQGIGQELMQRSIQECHSLFGEQKIKISAQVYLLRFYTNLGFQAVGEEYLEDGIPHTAMIYDGK